jgi:hypothetical protein
MRYATGRKCRRSLTYAAGADAVDANVVLAHFSSRRLDHGAYGRLGDGRQAIVVDSPHESDGQDEQYGLVGAGLSLKGLDTLFEDVEGPDQLGLDDVGEHGIFELVHWLQRDRIADCGDDRVQTAPLSQTRIEEGLDGVGRAEVDLLAESEAACRFDGFGQFLHDLRRLEVAQSDAGGLGQAFRYTSADTSGPVLSLLLDAKRSALTAAGPEDNDNTLHSRRGPRQESEFNCPVVEISALPLAAEERARRHDQTFEGHPRGPTAVHSGRDSAHRRA